MFRKALCLLVLLLPAVLARSTLSLPEFGHHAPPEACNACLGAVRLVDSALSDASMDAFVGFMDKEMCAHVQGCPHQCRVAARGFLPVFAQWFKASATPAGLCSAPQVCGTKLQAFKSHAQPLQRLPRDSTTCGMCTFVLNKVKLTLNDTSVQATIMEKALEVCNSLPVELAKGCADFVQTYEPLVSQFIESADSTELCMLMGACLGDIVAALPAPPALPLGLVTQLAAAQAGMAQHAAAPANDACDVCKMAVIEAHSLISNPDVQAELTNYTKALCSLFGGPLTEACEEYVDAYAPVFFQLLESFLTPDELCAQLGICKPPMMMMLRQQAEMLISRFGSMANGKDDGAVRRGVN